MLGGLAALAWPWPYLASALLATACLVRSPRRAGAVQALVLVGALAVCVWGQGVADFIADWGGADTSSGRGARSERGSRERSSRAASVGRRMSPQASPGDAGSSARRTSLWQLALVALALAAFFLYVLLPIGTLTLLFSGLVGFFWAQQRLEHVGALEPGAFGGAVYLSGALLLLGAVLLLLTAGWNLLRRMAGETRPPRLLLRWPWWTFGFGLLLASHFFIPSGPRESEIPGFAGALVLATAVWTVLSVGYLFYTLGTGGLSLAWRLARVSPFGAGLLTVGALACVGAMMLLGAVMDEFASRVRAMPRPRPDRSCSAPAMECARRLFLASPRATESSALSASAGASASPWSFPETSSRGMGAGSLEEPESSRSRRLRECLESQYKNRDLLDKAWHIAAAGVNRADAWDLVHTTLMSVCLRAGERYDFEQFFLRSVTYGVYSWHRRPGNVRTCAIDSIPEPECDLRPDDQYVRFETQVGVHKALCTLRDEDRQVLMLSYFDELSDLEISERLGISHAAVRKRLQRAREKLEEKFLQQCQ